MRTSATIPSSASSSLPCGHVPQRNSDTQCHPSHLTCVAAHRCTLASATENGASSCALWIPRPAGLETAMQQDVSAPTISMSERADALEEQKMHELEHIITKSVLFNLADRKVEMVNG